MIPFLLIITATALILYVTQLFKCYNLEAKSLQLEYDIARLRKPRKYEIKRHKEAHPRDLTKFDLVEKTRNLVIYTFDHNDVAQAYHIANKLNSLEEVL